MTKTCEIKDPKLLSIKDAAKKLGVHYRQLLAAVNEGLVPSYQLRSSRRLVNIQEVLKAMNPAYKNGGNHG